MASLLSQYREMREQLNAQLKENCLPPDCWMGLQELMYRINVLESFSTFLATAPVSTDNKVLGYHFNLVDFYVGCLYTERKFTSLTGADAEKKRKTAEEMFMQVITDNRKQFKSFIAKSDQHYKNCMSKYIDTILCAWIQYRNTYTYIKIKEA